MELETDCLWYDGVLGVWYHQNGSGTAVGTVIFLEVRVLT
jgi:hypothetical protein